MNDVDTLNGLDVNSKYKCRKCNSTLIPDTATFSTEYNEQIKEARAIIHCVCSKSECKQPAYVRDPYRQFYNLSELKHTEVKLNG